MALSVPRDTSPGAFLFLLLFFRNHVREFRGCETSVKPFAFTRGEFDGACKTGVERVVAAAAHIQTGMDFCAALAHDDRACVAPLSVVDFHAESF